MVVATRQPSNQLFGELKSPEVSRKSDSASYEGQRITAVWRKKEDDAARVSREQKRTDLRINQYATYKLFPHRQVRA